jgi:hypothetical protein
MGGKIVVAWLLLGGDYLALATYYPFFQCFVLLFLLSLP